LAQDGVILDSLKDIGSRGKNRGVRVFRCAPGST
jgi:hypothetical protein